MKKILLILLFILVFSSSVEAANKFITAYKQTDFTTSEISYIAARFNLINCYKDRASQVTAMKVISPYMKAIFYEDAITYDGAQAYYVLDSGFRLEHKTYGWLLADIGNASFRSYLANLIAADLLANPMFDGVFLDDVWWDLSEHSTEFYREGTTTEATIPAATITNWRTNMVLLLTQIKAAINANAAIKNYLLIINTYYYADSYISIADGYMNEAFGHPAWEPYGNFTSTWKARLDAMVTQTTAGKIVLAQAGVSSGTTAEIEKAEKYCYSLFLLGQNSNAYYYFSTNYREIQWYPEWDLNIGTFPDVPYTTVSSTVLQRRYKKGFVTIDSSAWTGMVYALNDFTVQAVPTLTKPAKNVPYVDPVFGTTITRISDGAVEYSPSSTLNYPGWVRHDAENANGTKLWLQTIVTPARFLYDANPPFTKGVGLPWESYDPDFRWHKTNPDILYYTHDAGFYKYVVSTGVSTLLHNFQLDFPGYPVQRVIAREGGNPSSDGRYWAWTIQCLDVAHDPTTWDHALIVYDKDYYGEDVAGPDGQVGKMISTLLETDTDKFVPGYFINISPSGNYVYVDTTNYVYVYPRSLASVLKIPYPVSRATVHAFPGCGYDELGNEVFVWVEEKGESTGEYWVVMVDMVTGLKTYLIYFGQSPLFNASMVNLDKPGWAVMSGCKTPGTAPQSWSDGEIFILELTKARNPNVWRIGQSHVLRGTADPHASDLFSKMNKKGTKVWFRTGWGTAYADGGTSDTYQIDLPVGWETIVAGGGATQPNPLKGMIIDDFTFYPPPIGMAKPAKGVPYIDPIFKTEIVRITDSATELHGQNYDQGSTGYPKYSNENADGTRLLVQSAYNSGWHLYNANPPYNKIKDLPTSIFGFGVENRDLRWDAENPNIVYYSMPYCEASGLRVYFARYNVLTDENVILRYWDTTLAGDVPDAFSRIAQVSLLEEGRPSDNSRYWAFGGIMFQDVGARDLRYGTIWSEGQPEYIANYYKYISYAIISFDKDFYGKDGIGPDGQVGKIVAKLKIGEVSGGVLTHPDADANCQAISIGSTYNGRCFQLFGDTMASPSGNYVVITNTQYIYPFDLSWVRKGKNAGGHNCVGWSKENREVIFGYTTQSGKHYATMEDLETGTQTILMEMGFPSQHHSAVATSNKGYGIISKYYATGGSSHDPGIANTWGDYETYMVELTTGVSPKTWRLAHTHTTPYTDQVYFDASFAKINHKGTKVWFGTAWDIPFFLHNPYDTYQINLPEGWYTYLAGGGGGGGVGPSILTGIPSGEQNCAGVSPTAINLQITTDRSGTCKYSLTDTTYDLMSNTFSTTGGLTHSQSLLLPCGANYTYYTRCMDDLGVKNTGSFPVSFSILASEGNTLIGNSKTVPTSLISGQYIVGSPFTAPLNGSANPGVLHAYLSTSGGDTNVVCGAYADNGGTFQGANKLSTDVVLTNLGATAGWRKGPIIWNDIAGGQTYWLVCSLKSNAWIGYDPTTTSKFNLYTYTGSLPSTGPSVFTMDYHSYSIYISYQSGEAPQPVQGLIIIMGN